MALQLFFLLFTTTVKRLVAVYMGNQELYVLVYNCVRVCIIISILIFSYWQLFNLTVTTEARLLA